MNVLYIFIVNMQIVLCNRLKDNPKAIIMFCIILFLLADIMLHVYYYFNEFELNY